MHEQVLDYDHDPCTDQSKSVNFAPCFSLRCFIYLVLERKASINCLGHALVDPVLSGNVQCF